MLPSVIWVLLFSYLPMYGIYMAFVNYQPGMGAGGFLTQLFTSKGVGLSWFRYFFTSTDFYTIMRNTIAQSVLTFVFSFPAPIILAVALNEVRVTAVKRVVQTASYLPYFISWVIAANMIVTLLSSEGAVNNILTALGLTREPIIFLQEPKLFWFIVAGSNVWKETGYNSVIYLAAIASINPELYESASIDGANKTMKIRHIILPSLKPTIAILLILSSSNLINAGFEQQFLLMNQTVMNVAEVIDTYNYRYGLVRGMYSYATAIGLFKTVISFGLLVFANQMSKRLSTHGLF